MSTNLKKKALFPVIAMVLVSVIALSSVTYAWFTMSNFATVSDLNVNVKSADGIQISLDGYKWKSTLSVDEIKNAIGNKLTNYATNTNQYPTDTILPVSTAGETNTSGQLKMFSGKLENDILVTDVLKDSENGNYIAFDLFFNMSKQTTVSLDMAGSAVSDPANSLIHSSYSARVAFLNYGMATSASAAQGLTDVKEVKIWEPNATTHLDGSTGAVAYKGVKLASTNALTTEGALADVTVTDFDTDASLFTFEKGINKVRVYIWMEGQDIDCINDASGGSFITNLKFTQPETVNN